MVGIDTDIAVVDQAQQSDFLHQGDIVLELDTDQLVGILVEEDIAPASVDIAKVDTKHDQPHINNDSYLALAGSYDGAPLQ